MHVSFLSLVKYVYKYILDRTFQDVIVVCGILSMKMILALILSHILGFSEILCASLY